MVFVLLVFGAGCVWHGVQVIWVAPKPSQFEPEKPLLEKGSAQAFQRFWLDQYAWLGISLCVFGVGLIVVGVVL